MCDGITITPSVKAMRAKVASHGMSGATCTPKVRKVKPNYPSKTSTAVDITDSGGLGTHSTIIIQRDCVLNDESSWQDDVKMMNTGMMISTERTPFV
jgi:hypothetical protein